MSNRYAAYEAKRKSAVASYRWRKPDVAANRVKHQKHVAMAGRLCASGSHAVAVLAVFAGVTTAKLARIEFVEDLGYCLDAPSMLPPGGLSSEDGRRGGPFQLYATREEV